MSRSGGWSGSVLARAAARALVGDDDAVDEQLASPDAGSLFALERAGQAEGFDRAFGAKRLGPLDRGRMLREPEIDVIGLGMAVRRWWRPACACPGVSGLRSTRPALVSPRLFRLSFDGGGLRHRRTSVEILRCAEFRRASCPKCRLSAGCAATPKRATHLSDVWPASNTTAAAT